MDRHSYNRICWYRIPKERAKTLKTKRITQISTGAILLKDVGSPPARQPRKDFTNKTPSAIILQENIKDARR